MSTVLATGGRGSVAPAGAELGLCEWNFIGNYEESVKADHANPRGVREIQSETGRDGRMKIAKNRRIIPESVVPVAFLQLVESQSVFGRYTL